MEYAIIWAVLKERKEKMKFNEWHPDGKMVADGAISIVKVKNLLKKHGIVDIVGKNIRVNGQLRGCYGFAKCPNGGNGKIVYFFSSDMLHNALRAAISLLLSSVSLTARRMYGAWHLEVQSLIRILCCLSRLMANSRGV